METSIVQESKLAIVAATGLSKDALHIYAGLGACFLAYIVFRKSLRSLFPLAVVVALACLVEGLDAVDDLRSLGHWRWKASLHDLLNTAFWPFVLLVLARWTSVLSRR